MVRLRRPHFALALPSRRTQPGEEYAKREPKPEAFGSNLSLAFDGAFGHRPHPGAAQLRIYLGSIRLGL